MNKDETGKNKEDGGGMIGVTEVHALVGRFKIHVWKDRRRRVELIGLHAPGGERLVFSVAEQRARDRRDRVIELARHVARELDAIGDARIEDLNNSY